MEQAKHGVFHLVTMLWFVTVTITWLFYPLLNVHKKTGHQNIPRHLPIKSWQSSTGLDFSEGWVNMGQWGYVELLVVVVVVVICFTSTSNKHSKLSMTYPSQVPFPMISFITATNSVYCTCYIVIHNHCIHNYNLTRLHSSICYQQYSPILCNYTNK